MFPFGAGGRGDPTRPVGLKAGDALEVHVLFRGTPLAAANLGWDRPGGGGELPAGTVRTAAADDALVPVAKAGHMTIRFTCTTRPAAADYERESFWPTRTFDIPAAPAR